MKKFLINILLLSLFGNYFFKAEKVKALIPYYYYPRQKSLEKESTLIGKKAYQILYFGDIENSLNLAKLAVQINKLDEKLWLILSEAEVANKLFDDALISLNNAIKINPNISEIYFAKSTIYLKQSKLQNARISLLEGLRIDPNNHRAIFQLGNIGLIEKNYSEAINFFDKAIKIQSDFWQAINNKGLAYFEQDKQNLSIKFFEKAISINDNAEPLLGLAACLSIKNINSAVLLAKKALIKNPKYVDPNFRKEQLWGEKLQNSTNKLLKNEKLQNDVEIAKSKINKIS